jgi:monofunctional glycosyltransferase
LAQVWAKDWAKDGGPVDETAQDGEPAPATPKEAPGADTAALPTAPEPRPAEVSPPVVDAPDFAPEPAEPNSALAVEPAPPDPVAAAPNAIAAAEIEGAAAALEPPADLAALAELTAVEQDVAAGAAPVDAPELEEIPEVEPVAGHDPPGQEPASEPVPGAALPPVVLVVPPPPELEAAGDEEQRSEAGAVSEPGAGEQSAEGLAAAARSAQEPPAFQPRQEAAGPQIGRQDHENGALEPQLDEGRAPDPTPAAPAEAGEAPDGFTATVAPETLLTEQAHPPETARRLEEVGEKAQLALSDARPPAAGTAADASPGPQHEPLRPEHERAAAAARALPVEAAPAWQAPERPVPPFPASLPRPLPSEGTASRPPNLRRALPYVRGALRAAAIGTAGLVVAVLALAVLYRWVNPPISALMIGRSLAGTEIERTWVPLARISPHLMRAVILSEDGGFCRHRGVDWSAIEEAIETDRGGSTITMQVVKNLFLWPSRSYVRKAIEIGLAYLVEALWSKRRILEIYLNIAEWGDGVFGAEAAAETHFGKSAARLTAGEAALLAAVLPNPIERTAGAPSDVTGRLASRLAVRMRASRADFSCVPVPRIETRTAPPRPPQQRSPQRSLERNLEKPPLVQGPRMTL